jgi:phosphatidylserine decarboxylase
MSGETHTLLAREGRAHIIVALLLVCVTWILFGFWIALPFILVALFVLQFFRDPRRVVPSEPGVVVAPADGKVIWTGMDQDPYLDRKAYKISIFMNVFNVHSNRIPVTGKIRKSWYHPGKFVNASLDKASVENERNAVWIQTGQGVDITCVQVAGLIARRILCYAGENDEVQRGQRYGFIRFGSRVDLFLPPHFEPLVACGAHTVGGVSVLGKIHEPGADSSPESRPSADRERT